MLGENALMKKVCGPGDDRRMIRMSCGRTSRRRFDPNRVALTRRYEGLSERVYAGGYTNTLNRCLCSCYRALSTVLHGIAVCFEQRNMSMQK